MKTVLAIGGAGYVGSHCCKALARAGWRVTTFGNLSFGWRDVVRWRLLIEGDILDLAVLTNAVAGVKPDIVMHFAALSSVADPVREPELFHRVNVGGTGNVLDAMQAAGVHRIVFSSSGAVYDSTTPGVLSETAPLRPDNPYGASKLAAEALLAGREVEAMSLRYFNAAGADVEGAPHQG